MKNSSSGYSLVEVLVALVLLFLLLFLSTKIFAYLTINHNNKAKIQAIKYADYYMKKTLSLKEFTDSQLELTKRFRLKRTIQQKGSLVLIEIIIFYKDRKITQLKAYEKNK